MFRGVQVDRYAYSSGVIGIHGKKQGSMMPLKKYYKTGSSSSILQIQPLSYGLLYCNSY